MLNNQKKENTLTVTGTCLSILFLQVSFYICGSPELTSHYQWSL